MRHYAIIDINKNRIISVCSISEDAEVLTNENEIIHEISEDQYSLIGTREAGFTIVNNLLEVTQLLDKIPDVPQQTEIELLQQEIANIWYEVMVR